MNPFLTVAMNIEDISILQRHLNEHQVSEITGLSVKTLQKYRHDMCGPCYVKLGRRVAYPEKDLAEWLSGKRVEPAIDKKKPKGGS